VNKKDEYHGEPDRIAWHPAFYEAIRLELEQYKDALEFTFEYQLTAEPLQMDVLIIKKHRDIALDKNIAAIFRRENIVEYKSPGDYVSVEDFYKVYGYACLYASLNKTPVTDLTITFVETRYPRELVKHLREVRGYGVEEKGEGIYLVTGDIIPIQIIESKRLSAAENIWLKGLSDDLDVRDLTKVTAELYGREKGTPIGAYIQAIYQANPERLREVIKMSNGAVTLDQVLIETGLAGKWKAEGKAEGEALGEARGEVLGVNKILRRALERGMPIEDIADLTGYTPQKITEYQETWFGESQV
jgi:hypothetical protein